MSEQENKPPIEKIQDTAHQTARAESEPAPVRRCRAGFFQFFLIMLAMAFGGLTFIVKTLPSLSIDLQITKGIQEITSPIFTWIMRGISWPGFTPQSIIISVLIILIIYAFGLHWEAVSAIFAEVFAMAVNVLVKDLIQRPRPGADAVNVFDVLKSYSFPSGHVMFYIGFFGFVAFLAFTLLKPSLVRSLIMVVIGILNVLVGPSRIFLGEHWASDVLGAYMLGTLTLVAIVQLYRWGKPRFFVHQPVAKN